MSGKVECYSMELHLVMHGVIVIAWAHVLTYVVLAYTSTLWPTVEGLITAVAANCS